MESFELNTLQQGSLSVEEFYNKLRDLMIRDGVIESAVITRNRFVCGVRKEIARLLPHRCKCMFTLLYHAKQIEEKLQQKEVENSIPFSLSYEEGSKEMNENVNMCEQKCENKDEEYLSEKEGEIEKKTEDEEEELSYKLCEKKNEGEEFENSITFDLSSLQVKGCDSRVENQLEGMVLLCHDLQSARSLTLLGEGIKVIWSDNYTFPFDRGKCDSRTNLFQEGEDDETQGQEKSAYYKCDVIAYVKPM